MRAGGECAAKRRVVTFEPLLEDRKADPDAVRDAIEVLRSLRMQVHVLEGYILNQKDRGL
jgi:hypothetical protein